MKSALTNKIQKGFTLIELVVVIGILGVLAAVLITTIDPLDKINAANDSGVVSTITQLGKANDSYAANNSNTYAALTGTGVAGTGYTQNFIRGLTTLNTAGEAKISTYTPPSGYTVDYAVAASGCPGGAVSCNAFWVSGLKSKKNTTNSIYVYANGQGCFKATGTTITATTTCP